MSDNEPLVALLVGLMLGVFIGFLVFTADSPPVYAKDKDGVCWKISGSRSVKMPADTTLCDAIAGAQ